MSLIQLNISTFSNSYSFFVSFTSLLILGQDHFNKIPFQALIDSGSTYCFDGLSNSIISKIANLPIIFSTNNCMNLDFYITLLDSSCSLVLEYNWLTQHNPLIDWANELINFHPYLQKNLTSSHVTANTLLVFLLLSDIPL